MPVRVLLIALGGGLGSITRYSLGKAWPDDQHTLPLTTLGINLLGSFLLGLLVVGVTEVWSDAHPNIRPFLGTGLLGGFTTFSTFAVQDQNLPGPDAAAYLVLSVAGGVLLAAAGMALLRALIPQRHPAPATMRDTTMDPDLP